MLSTSAVSFSISASSVIAPRSPSPLLRTLTVPAGVFRLTGAAAAKFFPLCETDRFAFDFEALCFATRFGMTVEEMPVTILNHGESKIRLLGDSVKMFRDILAIRRRVDRKMKEQKKIG